MEFFFGDGRDWFFEKRFGMFVHWGIYSIPAWHEQLQWRGRVPRNKYKKFADQFNPVHYDPDAWLDLAEEAGMEYICLTTKHHDGYCLWDTAYTDYKVTNSPYGKDIVAMLAEACHRRGIPLSLYYSAADWHHPNYPNQGRSHELERPEKGDEPDLEKYLSFMKAQIRELYTNYGEIHGLFWDMNVTGFIDPSINEMVRSLQPNVVINNRGFDEGDFGTPERDMDDSVNRVTEFARPTEACQSVGRESWGYREDEDYYSDRHLEASIDKILAKGGNYLLNVGPKADGTIPKESSQILGRIGKWYKNIKESFDQVEPVSSMTSNRDILLTRRDNTVYVHINNPPPKSTVLIKPMTSLPHTATLLNTDTPVDVRTDPLPSEIMSSKGAIHGEDVKYLHIRGLPVNDMSGTVMVVKLEFDNLP